MRNTYIFDIETDGLLDKATKVHVVAHQLVGEKEVHHTHDYNEMREFFSQKDITLVGHNIIRFDIPAVELLLGVKVECKIVDTLALSWYLDFYRPRHGLEGYGVDFGVPKVVIDDWDSLTPEDYAERCRVDVRINHRLFEQQLFTLTKLYPVEDDRNKFLEYLTFKLECAWEQESAGWKLDVEGATLLQAKLVSLKGEKEVALANAMPEIVKYKVNNQPKVPKFNKDGKPSKSWTNWFELLLEHKQPETSISFRSEASRCMGNPNSHAQVKDWLFSLGWVPNTFKYIYNKDTGEERKVEQVRNGDDLCSSVKKLADVEPSIVILDGLSVISHRLAVVNGFLSSVDSKGYVHATIAGLTNTLRFKHAKPLVNLPSVDKPWGKEVRGLLTAPQGTSLMGADMVSLEDTTKRHYMQPLDPSYVSDMSVEGFDPHLDLAKFAGAVTQGDIDKHNSGEVSLKALRKNYKVVNYSATYGVGSKTLSRTTGMKEGDAKKLLEAYWSRNWSVKKISELCNVKIVRGSMWLKNPVSGFWHSLRNDKDRFSTLNQSTGVYCFDTWVKNCRASGLKMVGQFHDEVITVVKLGEEEVTKATMRAAIVKANGQIKLNVPLGIDVQVGNTYADIH